MNGIVWEVRWDREEEGWYPLGLFANQQDAEDLAREARQLLGWVVDAGPDEIVVKDRAVQVDRLDDYIRGAFDTLRENDYSGDLWSDAESWARRVLDPEEGDLPASSQEIAVAGHLSGLLGIRVQSKP